ncbi:hypothetical protein [Desulfocurvibacter africanus]|uniref:Uncharacterized protein n=1 Tax=Desulfocurvibacter africanus subsp. africanus str. Walvis Bay TaxID=690850 RepID=F3YY21_DESAF|nr:hypothetical protein [Desulfocurvibacter africanus]EGJ51797.1 hypothetical protein Desaf_3513 [Desulfocurvibacter africanus subsp. africanus str. Walvis Bay]
MAQNYTIDMFAPGNQVQIDMQNIENNLECLRSMFSGLTTPANAITGQAWYDLNKSVLKQHNGTAWIGLMHGDAAQKLWVYRNAAMAGWVVDAAVSDRVLAVKGGTQAYNVNGGEMAGTWTISGLPGAHTHTISSDGNHRHSRGAITHSAALGYGWVLDEGGSVYYAYTDYQGSHSHGGATSSAGAITQNGTWRPAAAVGSLQYLDL